VLEELLISHVVGTVSEEGESESEKARSMGCAMVFRSGVWKDEDDGLGTVVERVPSRGVDEL